MNDTTRFKKSKDPMNTTVNGFNIQPESFNDLIENKYYNDFVDELQE